MLAAFINAIQEAQDGCAQFKVPYLLTHGTEDLLCDISGSELFHQKSASKDKKFSVSVYYLQNDSLLSINWFFNLALNVKVQSLKIKMNVYTDVKCKPNINDQLTMNIWLRTQYFLLDGTFHYYMTMLKTWKLHFSQEKHHVR